MAFVKREKENSLKSFGWTPFLPKNVYKIPFQNKKIYFAEKIYAKSIDNIRERWYNILI